MSKPARYHAIQLLQMVDDGIIDMEHLAFDLLGYLSEAEVEDFMRKNDYIIEEETE